MSSRGSARGGWMDGQGGMGGRGWCWLMGYESLDIGSE